MNSNTFTMTFLAIFPLFGVSAGVARADNTRHVLPRARHEIQNGYKRFAAAETSRSYKRVKQVTDSLFAPTFVLDTRKNTLNYTQFLSEMQATAGETRAVRINRFRTKTLKNRPDGSFLENGVYTFSRRAVDPDGDFGAKGLTHDIEFQTSYESVWVRADGRLRLQHLQFMKRHEVVDGGLRQ